MYEVVGVGSVLFDNLNAGGIHYCEDGLIYYPAYPVNAVDTNGAGDVYLGAFTVGLIKGMEPLQCACITSEVSAFKYTKLGAREGVPTYEEAIEFIKSDRRHNQ
jgi:sugar/nucleoside kinase (ribokinase family)